MKPALFIAVLMAIGTITALADPPAGTDPDSETAKWFRSLEQPNGNGGCCSESDCRAVDYRIAGDHYEAFIKQPEFPVEDNRWVAVPNEVVLKYQTNPTGRAVICYLSAAERVLCFVPPSQA